jgi:hypothetical protein
MVFSGSRKIPLEVLIAPNRWQFLLLVLIGVCIYSGTLNHTFSFDSIQQIVENPYIRALKPCWEHTYKQDVLCPAKEEWEKSLADLVASLKLDRLEVGPGDERRAKPAGTQTTQLDVFYTFGGR